MTEWQPIETAPRTGKRILLYSSRDDSYKVGRWNASDIDDLGYDADDAPEPCFMDEATRITNSEFGGYWDHPKPPATHWQPLPEPPL